MATARKLTHLDRRNRPQMVDVGGKRVTARTAVAAAVVVLPPALAAQLKGGEIHSRKGPVFQAAILAGIMGAKRTAELIPLCHPLPLDDCKVEIEAGRPLGDGSVEVRVRCTARTRARTGVEMEALTGAAVAALTLYDMGKAASHGIVVRDLRLLAKTGGKQDYHAT
jgi:cyclic pyranopterin phosphate synthase